ncbi:MAG: thermonuclease family protein [Weeksellaceae bacterium]
MSRRINLVQMYLIPLLFVGLVLLSEQITVIWDSQKTFEDIAKETNALGEVDEKVLVAARVAKVTDGDTIELESGEKVRYIGVDTPETKHPKKSVQCFGQEASLENKVLVEGKTIYMEKDVSETDRYGRLLRYIYIPNPEATQEAIFLNEYLVEQGFARVITYPPDVKYHSILKDAETEARENERGLWSKCE